MLLKFVKSIVVPSCNYGAYIDQDTESSRADYNQIDTEIIKFAREILFNIPSEYVSISSI